MLVGYTLCHQWCEWRKEEYSKRAQRLARSFFHFVRTHNLDFFHFSSLRWFLQHSHQPPLFSLEHKMDWWCVCELWIDCAMCLVYYSESAEIQQGISYNEWLVVFLACLSFNFNRVCLSFLSRTKPISKSVGAHHKIHPRCLCWWRFLSSSILWFLVLFNPNVFSICSIHTAIGSVFHARRSSEIEKNWDKSQISGKILNCNHYYRKRCIKWTCGSRCVGK